MTKAMQNGTKGMGLGKGKSRPGGKNQGKVSGAHSKYSAHPMKKGC